VFLKKTTQGLVDIYCVGKLVLRYIIMMQSEYTIVKMAGTVAVTCLLLLVAPACRGGLPQDEKYTTRLEFHTCTDIILTQQLYANYNDTERP
jgi:hypothetical protein